MDIKIKKKLLWATLLSVTIMAFLLIKVDWVQFSAIAEKLVVKDLLLSFGIFVLANFIRALRFYELDHLDKKLIRWWNINVFYNFITASLPGGVGEAATAYVLKRFSKFNLLGAFRILILSRLMDLFALSALFFISAIVISSVTPYRETAIWLSGVLFLISSVALLSSSKQYALKLLQGVSSRSILIKRVREKLSELFKITEEQRNSTSFGIALFQSVLMMAGGAAALYLLLRSYGVYFTPVQSAYCYSVYMVFQIVPVQGIAGIGTQGAWWALALGAAGYKQPDAIALGFVLHGTFYLFIASMGGSFLVALLRRKEKNFAR